MNQNTVPAIRRKPFRPPDARLVKGLYALGLGSLIGRFILLLTTTGRKTGLPRVTPLQYEEIDDVIYVGSSRGTRADWFQNILADPHVKVRVKSKEFQAIAQPVVDPSCVADFLELRLKRHLVMVGKILQAEGLSDKPSREELEAYAGTLAMVIIRPVEREEH